MRAGLHDAAVDALYRRDHGLPPVDGDNERIAALDRALTAAQDAAVAVAHEEWLDGLDARWAAEVDE